MAPELSVSVVIYRANLEELRATLHSLRSAAEHARSGGLIAQVRLWIVDNGENDVGALDHLLAQVTRPPADWLRVELMRGHGNVGFGRGHNLAILRSAASYHLVLNPDVVLAPDALMSGLRYLADHPRVGMVSPYVQGADGERQYLCKRYPSVLVLALRGFAPAWLRAAFRRRLEHYEMRDLPSSGPVGPIPIASGCFMLCRRAPLEVLGGFSPDYFLYFEDFDLSLRFAHEAEIAYVPAVRITHTGGNAASKGWRHRRLFLRSAATFFGRHGWRVW